MIANVRLLLISLIKLLSLILPEPLFVPKFVPISFLLFFSNRNIFQMLVDCFNHVAIKRQIGLFALPLFME